MSFFDKIGPVQYGGKRATNLLTAVMTSRLNIDSSYVYQEYDIIDGDTPESLAEEYYNDSNLYWVFYVVNSIVNPYHDWPMTTTVFNHYVSEKYDDQYAIHHYIDTRIDRVCDDVDTARWRSMPAADLPAYIRPITNYQYEEDENDEKRKILMIVPRYINQFVDEYRKAQGQ